EAAEDRDEPRVREAATLRGHVVLEDALDQVGGPLVEEAAARTVGGVAVQHEVGAGEGAAVVDAAAAQPARVQAVTDRDAVDLVRAAGVEDADQLMAVDDGGGRAGAG